MPQLQALSVWGYKTKKTVLKETVYDEPVFGKWEQEKETPKLLKTTPVNKVIPKNNTVLRVDQKATLSFAWHALTSHGRYQMSSFGLIRKNNSKHTL